MAGIRDEGLFKNADESSTAETETETETNRGSPPRQLAAETPFLVRTSGLLNLLKTRKCLFLLTFLGRMNLRNPDWNLEARIPNLSPREKRSVEPRSDGGDRYWKSGQRNCLQPSIKHKLHLTKIIKNNTDLGEKLQHFVEDTQPLCRVSAGGR